MPRVGVSITKSCSFRGATQEFSNVYYYNVATQLTPTQADQLIDDLTTLEKTFHSNIVTFVRGRVWTETGNIVTNEMLSQKNLSGTGARQSIANLDPERAFLFRRRAGVDSRGNPVYLRKWYHAVGEFVSTQGIPAGLLTQTTSWSTAQRTAQENAMSPINGGNFTNAVQSICAKSGRVPDAGSAWTAHAWLEHHQLGDQWRAQ